MTKVVAVAVVALALAGCDQKAMEANFNASFDKSTHDSCVRSASSSGAAADVIERYCACTVAQLDKYPVAEKMKLGQEPDKLRAAAEACKPTSRS